ncbi:MAG: ABC transporter substrate-binding protein [Flammeovirgaceae bacterium]|nr:MAG: ABC transporter substrate-binding protein [Flammeovirgaceae bacterium]
MRICFLLCCLLILCRCENPSGNQSSSGQSSDSIKYASGFTVKYVDEAKLVEVLNPYPGAKSGYRYLLVQHDRPVPANPYNARIIRVPVKRIVCTSTTHIPLLDYLEETDALTGFPTLDYISSQKTRKRIDDGKILDLGIDKGMDIERLALLKPDMVMGYTMTADIGQFKKIEEMGIPVVINAEYLEKHPLGRAEWIKFMALFFNKEKLADSVFRAIEREYLITQDLVKTVTLKPTVLSGILYRDAWFLPGGQNYAARLLRDAGCRYLWEADSSNGFLELSFESVYARAQQADLWIGVASFTALSEMAAADNRYTKFSPFINRKVFTYNARKGAKGGSEFLELGYLRPDIILKDLVKIAHPELLPDHKLYFHAQLQ